LAIFLVAERARQRMPADKVTIFANGVQRPPVRQGGFVTWWGTHLDNSLRRIFGNQAHQKH
jgi:hypothetical protein